MRKTKIIATLGPVSSDYSVMKRLWKAGVNVFRLNMSHGDEKSYRQIVKHLNRLRKQEKADVALLWDLQGPEIRTGEVEAPYRVEKKEVVCFTNRPDTEVGRGVVSVSYEEFPESFEIGDRFEIGNGALRFEVIGIHGSEVRTKALNTGTIKSRMHVNLPGKTLKMPSLSPKDLEDLKLGLKLGADWIALSFVRSAKDVEALRKELQKRKSEAGLMVKIETADAVKNFEKILPLADAVMVARGDLGSEIPFEQVPQVQDLIVSRCLESAKPVVIATHMLESMMQSPTPTRAEATDITHAVNTRADATMLSGETAVGEYPVGSVEAMDRILQSAELVEYAGQELNAPNAEGNKEELLLSASSLAENIDAQALLVFSRSGETALSIARNRPSSSLIVFTESSSVHRQLNLVWGIQVHQMTFLKRPQPTLEKALKFLRDKKLISSQAPVVVVSDSLFQQQRVPSIFVYTP